MRGYRGNEVSCVRCKKSGDFGANNIFWEAVDFVRISFRDFSNGHGCKVVHFCTTFEPIASDFGESGANLHHMRRFRHFMLESGAFLHYIPKSNMPHLSAHLSAAS
jgi:hypothetical protein